ncbi:MAG: hypothetical protein QF464_18280, partial [Myxococcota bacterium]|nr:hypothetical protein [Myxococcota bacterium]
MTQHEPSKSARRPVWAVCGVVVLAACGVAFVPAVASYFFVFDDYRLFGQAMGMSIVELVTRPNFLYFRPTVHLGAWAETAVFGWAHPWAYAGVGLVVHTVNSALLVGLLRKLHMTPTAGLLAGTLFFVAPWTLEAVFWASCRFDLIACACALGAAHLVVGAGRGQSTNGRSGLLFTVALLAFASKETALSLGLAAALCWRLVSPAWRDQADARRLRTVAFAAVAYLACRWLSMAWHVTPDPLAGHRGNLLVLLGTGDVLGNAIAHLGALLWPPVASCGLLWPPGASWGLLGPPGASWGLLGPPGASWGLLGSPGASWGLLGPPGASWGLLGPPGASWGLLGSPGPSWGLLGPPGASWGLLGTPGASWRLPGPPGASWGLLGPSGVSWGLLGPPD